MSEQALKEFEAERKKILEAQRICSWCQEKFETSRALSEHILEKHPQGVSFQGAKPL